MTVPRQIILLGNYEVKDYNDLMEFIDKVLEAYPQIDKFRAGMTGGCYGGFMANWIVGHTDRFAVMASQRSISYFISKCVTQTLFIQSDEDYLCWMADAIQMLTALRMHGCPTRLRLFHGEITSFRKRKNEAPYPPIEREH